MPPSEEDLATLQVKLRRLREQSLLQQIELIQQTLPDIWTVAERFVSETKYQPWEFAVAYQKGELGKLQERWPTASDLVTTSFGWSALPTRHSVWPATVL